MKLEEFLEKLDVLVNGFQNENQKITYTVSKAKGVITVLGAYHFPNEISCEQAFKELELTEEELDYLEYYLEMDVLNDYLTYNDVNL